MNKKITRRVVLGTAIAGLAAGPFAIRALRKKNPFEISGDRNVPSSDARHLFFQEWQKVYQSLETKQSPLNIPKEVALKYDFSRSRNMSFRSLETYLIGKLNSPESAQPTNMMQYTLMEGVVEINEKDKGMLFVTVDKHEQKHLEIDIEASRKNGAEITKTSIKNPDGTTRPVEVITKPSFSYDEVLKRYKTDVAEKEVTTSLTTGQFTLNQLFSLDLDRDNSFKLSSLPDGAMIMFLACNDFFPLIRFPFPDHSLEISKYFECSTNLLDILRFDLPFYKALFQGMVNCNGLKSLDIIPYYGSDISSYSNFLQKQYDVFSKTGYDGITEEQDKESKQAFLRIIEQKKERFKKGVPSLKYLIDSETGIVIRREEYDTSKNYSDVVSAVHRLFQLT